MMTANLMAMTGDVAGRLTGRFAERLAERLPGHLVGSIGVIGTKTPALLLQAVDGTGMTPDQQFALAQEALRHNNFGLAGAIGALVPVAMFAMIAVVIWLKYRQRQAQVRVQADLRKQMLDKFGTGAELAAFLESKGGQQFLEELKWQDMGRSRGPWFLTGLYAGVSLTMLGLAFLGLTLGGRRGFLVAAVVLLALGIGYLISAAINYRLSKSQAQNSGPGANPTNAPIA